MRLYADMISRYYLGGARDGSTIYWQIDKCGMVRGGKLINYNPDTGHRCKEVAHPVTWVHSILKSKGLLPDSWQLSQCLFGAHLLADPKNDNKAVGIVEAEKTACICSLIMPTYIWMACGGLEQLKSNNKLSILKDHAIILYPDIDGYEKWREDATELKAEGYNINVSDYLEKVATEADRAAKVDIADITMRYIEQTPGWKQDTATTDTTTAQEIKPLKILSQPTCNDSKTKTPRDINVTIARKTQPKERGRCLECGNAYLMGDGDNPIICMCKAMKNERFVASTSRLCKLYKSVEALPLPLHDMILCNKTLILGYLHTPILGYDRFTYMFFYLCKIRARQQTDTGRIFQCAPFVVKPHAAKFQYVSDFCETPLNFEIFEHLRKVIYECLTRARAKEWKKCVA
jgi:hypothetical protein